MNDLGRQRKRLIQIRVAAEPATGTGVWGGGDMASFSEEAHPSFLSCTGGGGGGVWSGNILGDLQN